MKNYDELTNDLLERRDRYVANQKKRRKSVLGVATSLCCFSLVALLVFSVWQGGFFHATPSGHTLRDPLHPTIQGGFDESKSESPDNPAANHQIVVNATDEISTDKMNICLMWDDRIELSIEEMLAYYGVDLIPELPADIQIWPDQCGNIFKRNGGTGEVYWDGNQLTFSNEDFTRLVHVAVDKGSYVLQDFLYFKGTEEKSVIHNTEAVIGLTDYGCYYSEFLYQGVGFLISAEGVTEEEFIAIIASIIQ